MPAWDDYVWDGAVWDGGDPLGALDDASVEVVCVAATVVWQLDFTGSTQEC
jgi:hypothetical protein